MEARDAGFQGSLAATPLPQVLRRIFFRRLKGTLRLARREEIRNLFFENGELRTATSSREVQKIGTFLKRRGWVTDRDLAWALETVARQGRARLGKILVERGLVSRSVLEAEMKRLVEEIVFSTFEWAEGEYRFAPSAGNLDPDVALDLSTASIVVEGIRRLPESELFRDRLPDGKRIPVLSDDPMSRYQYLPLTPQEAFLLSRVDGTMDLDALLKLSGASRAASAKTLYALVSCGILEWKSETLHSPGGRGSRAPERGDPLAAGGRADPDGALRDGPEHLPPRRLAHALRAARRRSRREPGGDPAGVFRAEPLVPPRPAAPGGPGRLREGAFDRLRPAEDRLRNALGPEGAGRVRRRSRRTPLPTSRSKPRPIRRRVSKWRSATTPARAS